MRSRMRSLTVIMLLRKLIRSFHSKSVGGASVSGAFVSGRTIKNEFHSTRLHGYEWGGIESII